MLMLSELAGAAYELEGAIFVNPYDMESFSESIRTTLIISQKEKKMEKDIYKPKISGI